MEFYNFADLILMNFSIFLDFIKNIRIYIACFSLRKNI